MKKQTLVAATLLYLSVTAVSAADPPLGTRSLELDAQTYARLWNEGGGMVRAFPLPGRRPVDLDLHAFQLIAPDARFLVVDEDGEREVPRPAIRFFRGSVADDPDGRVVLSLFEGRVAGSIRAFGEEFGVGPQDFNLARGGGNDVRVWNRRRTEELSHEPLCEREHDPGPRRRGIDAPPGPVTPDTGLLAHVAIDATVEWFNHFGSLAAAQNYILNLMAEVSTIYDTQLLVQIDVPFLRVFTAEPDPYTNGSTSPSTLLADLKAEWDANQTGVSRTTAHLFSHRTSGGSGTAYVDVLCDSVSFPTNSFDYGVSTLEANGAAFEQRLVAHELGHNFSSPHTNCYTPEIDQCYIQSGCYSGPEVQTVGTIMSRCDTRIPQFHPRVEDEKIRPGAEAAFPSCIDLAGLPGDIRDQTGDGLSVDIPTFCPTQALVNDDGGANGSSGTFGSDRLAWIKRFTPSCYPFRLEGIEVMIHSGTVSAGRPIRALVYTDPTGSGDPANATLAYTEETTIQVVSSSVFNQYTLAAPITVNSGDLYLGFYDLDPDGPDTFIASRDTGTFGDAYFAVNSTDPGDMSPRPSDTWLIRGSGGSVLPGSVVLDWGLPCNDATAPGQDFAVYRGDVGTWGVYDNLTCSTALETNYFAEAAPPNSFFLVVPSTSAAEGSYGRDGDDFERTPTPASACKIQSAGACP